MQIDKAIVFCERDGHRALELDLYLPDVSADGPRPVVLYVHGGGWRVSHRSRAPRETRAWTPDFFELLTDAGFVVAANDYRFSGEALFPAAVDDTAEAVRWLHANAGDLGIDPDRVYLWGASAGGHLAASVGLATDVGAVGGVVCWYPITDMRVVDQLVSDSYEALFLGGPVGERPELALAASPAAHVHAGAPPFHLVHGTADAMVPSEHSVRLAAALRGVGSSVALELVEGADHFFEGASSDEIHAIFDRSLGFLRSLATR